MTTFRPRAASLVWVAAWLSVLACAHQAITGLHGVGRMNAIPTGSHELHVLRIGFEKATVRVTVTAYCVPVVALDLVPACGFHQSCPPRKISVAITPCFGSPDATHRSTASG